VETGLKKGQEGNEGLEEKLGKVKDTYGWEDLVEAVMTLKKGGWGSRQGWRKCRMKV